VVPDRNFLVVPSISYRWFCGSPSPQTLISPKKNVKVGSPSPQTLISPKKNVKIIGEGNMETKTSFFSEHDK
jgi:hypothetical protein